MNTFKNWSKSSYWIYSIGVIVLVSLTISVSKLNTYTVISLIGALFGFLSVVLIVNRNSSAGYVGIVSALIYMFVSWRLGNYSDTILNVLFIIFLNLPLIFNKKYAKSEIPNSTKENRPIKVILMFIFVVVYASLFGMEVIIFNAPRPIFSVLAATLGIVASIATSVFVLKESFVIWGAQNIFQVVLFSITYYQTRDSTALIMLVTYLLYTINASTAFFNGKWFVDKKQ